MPHNPPGIAILGAGIFAKEAHLPALAKIASGEATAFSLKAVYSRSQASSQSLAASAKDTLGLSAAPEVYYDVSENGPATESVALDTLLKRDDIAIVIIVLPITMQPEIIIRALAAGKHVLSEKPVAPDCKAGAELIAKYIAEYKPKGLLWRVAENFEAEPGYRAAAKVVADGKIGAVVGFDVRMVNYIDEDSKWYKTPWRTVPDYQGGFLLDGGVHFAAALRILVDSPLASLSGHASLKKKFLAPHDTITASVRTESGAHGTFSLTFASPAGPLGEANGYTIFGEHGWLTLRGKDGNTIVVVHTVTTKPGVKDPEVAEETISEPQRGVEAEIVSFLAAVAGSDDGLGLGDPRNTLKDVAFIEACLKSDGRPIDLYKLAASGVIE